MFGSSSNLNPAPESKECVGFVSNMLLASFGMTAAAICMRCGVFACVYSPLFFPHDTTTTLMPPTTTNHDCEGWGELDGDFGECGGLEEQNKYHPRPSFTACGTITPASDSIERRDIDGSGCSLVLRSENHMQNVAVADSCKIQVSCACESAGLNYVVQTFFSYYGLVYAFAPSNTAAKDFFDPRMTEWVKEDGGCNMYRAWQGMYRAWNVWGGTSFVNPEPVHKTADKILPWLYMLDIQFTRSFMQSMICFVINRLTGNDTISRCPNNEAFERYFQENPVLSSLSMGEMELPKGEVSRRDRKRLRHKIGNGWRNLRNGPKFCTTEPNETIG
ncbi:hypothetical protein B0H14DRAFT_2616050 [Mycena olivaceomarginata]|nr:hypothetical protein B0H14DRAFT_2616050 [Mycena olivaceomarginata]